MTFQESKRDVTKLERALESNTEVSFHKPCQSGKTDVMVEFVVRKKYEMAMFFLCCNVPSVAITTQTISRIKEGLGVKELPSNIVVGTPTKIKNKVKELKAFIGMMDTTYVLLDETHTHFTDKGQGNTLREIADTTKSFKGVYFTATPSVQGIVGLECVRGEVGEGYHGLETLLPKWNYLAENTESYSDDYFLLLGSKIKVWVKEELAKLEVGEAAIIRPGYREYARFELELRRMGFNVKECAGSGDWNGLEELVNGEIPSNLRTVYLLKQGLGCGVTIKDKTRIVLLIETLKANEAAVIQGLPGRMCGYSPINPKLRGFCDRASLLAAIELKEGRTTYVSSSNVRNATTFEKEYRWRKVNNAYSVSTEPLGKGTYNANLTGGKENKATASLLKSYKPGANIFKDQANSKFTQLTVDVDKAPIKQLRKLRSIMSELGLVEPDTNVWYIRCERYYGEAVITPQETIKEGTFTHGL